MSARTNVALGQGSERARSAPRRYRFPRLRVRRVQGSSWPEFLHRTRGRESSHRIRAVRQAHRPKFGSPPFLRVPHDPASRRVVEMSAKSCRSLDERDPADALVRYRLLASRHHPRIHVSACRHRPRSVVAGVAAAHTATLDHALITMGAIPPLSRGPSSAAIPTVRRFLSIQLSHVSCGVPNSALGAVNPQFRTPTARV